KMDNEIASDFDGVISFKVTKGTNVETDDIVATIG
ncbi:MAG TPA: acetyl-CoA carboxylase biotin carboxyl carrier protein subunit, partial [Clostridiales bacterium]|nr:acetyl-CoA carboxylase biotin carboxyl carrier protein subunit [Clostridiales bacterium]